MNQVVHHQIFRTKGLRRRTRTRQDDVCVARTGPNSALKSKRENHTHESFPPRRGGWLCEDVCVCVCVQDYAAFSARPINPSRHRWRVVFSRSVSFCFSVVDWISLSLFFTLLRGGGKSPTSEREGVRQAIGRKGCLFFHLFLLLLS